DVVGDRLLSLKPLDLHVGQLGELFADAHGEYGGADGDQVGGGKVAVVVGALFRAAQFGAADLVVPPPGRLGEGASRFEFVNLASDFVVEGAPHGGNGVEVSQLDLGAEFALVRRAHGDVHVTAHLPFFHVGIGDAAVDEDLPERVEVGDGLLGGIDLRFGDDLHQGRPGAVEVDGGVGGVVGRFG